MYSLSKTAVYFLIFTVIGSVVAYKLVIASYKSYNYDYVSDANFEVKNTIRSTGK